MSICINMCQNLIIQVETAAVWYTRFFKIIAVLHETEWEHEFFRTVHFYVNVWPYCYVNSSSYVNMLKNWLVIITLIDVNNREEFWVQLVTYLEGSGVAVKKWMQGRVVSLGRTDTMLPVVQKPPESMQMPLGLSLRMDIMTSAVTEPLTFDRATEYLSVTAFSKGNI